ncbi:hypothetical protein [Sulfoacidibacillus ferrooxidans]|uniref:Uncharacterized protein n=1 Tax=Sulfoacidibacillus ferrooxidans TaxID=2005001 RepID=A0A9X1V7D4_9BACL|nr:hypothetical protein [Sulfoacidibacillus ferrooxidans]MCI0183031.1 hypothetical protein [Sulfoacidibacillus ferrooxidans]
MDKSNAKFQTKIWAGILITGVGISAIGDLIYLVSINIFILSQTHSPSAVAGLWLDSVSFFFYAMLCILLPDLDKPKASTGRIHPWRTVFTDWQTAFQFLRENRPFTVLFSLNALIGIFALTADKIVCFHVAKTANISLT